MSISHFFVAPLAKSLSYMQTQEKKAPFKELSFQLRLLDLTDYLSKYSPTLRKKFIDSSISDAILHNMKTLIGCLSTPAKLSLAVDLGQQIKEMSKIKKKERLKVFVLIITICKIAFSLLSKGILKPIHFSLKTLSKNDLFSQNIFLKILTQTTSLTNGVLKIVINIGKMLLGEKKIQNGISFLIHVSDCALKTLRIFAIRIHPALFIISLLAKSIFDLYKACSSTL